MWYIIPKDYYVFKIDSFTPKIGKQGKKINLVVGWESKYSDITFSMSSQLWFHFTFNDIKKYIIYKHIVNLNEYNNISFSKFYKIIKENKELFK